MARRVARFALTDAGSPPFFLPTAALLREHAEGRLYAGGWWLVPGLNASVTQFMTHWRAGRVSEARAITEELTLAAMRLRSSPLRDEYRRGVFVGRVATQLFRELARTSPDTAFARRVSDAANAARQVDQRTWAQDHFHNLWALAGNLGASSDVLPAIADRRLRPHERWHMMSAIVTSYCTNAREILCGISPRRRVFLDSADRWRENPRAEYLQLMEGRLDRRRTLTDVFGWLGFTDMHARMKYCAEIG